MKKWNDETIIPFKTKGVSGKSLGEIEDWWFKHYWKMNDLWYADRKRAVKSKTDGFWSSYDKNRYALMDYIESNFKPEEL